MKAMIEEPAFASSGVTSEGDRTDKYLTVTLGDERLGIPVACVKEIMECGAVSSMPLAPPAVRGAINLRGKVVPVIDLGVRFGSAPVTIGRRSCIIIAEVVGGRSHQPFDVGLLVDAVNEVIDIAPRDIEQPPSMDGAIRTDFTAGLGRMNGGFVLLLRLDTVVDVADFAAIVQRPALAKDGGS